MSNIYNPTLFCILIKGKQKNNLLTTQRQQRGYLFYCHDAKSRTMFLNKKAMAPTPTAISSTQ